MDEVTTATRDGWNAHYEDALELMQKGYDELSRAARHLETGYRGRVTRVCEKQEKLIVRAMQVRDDIRRLRAADRVKAEG